MKRLLLVLALAAGAYIAYPYFTLWQLGRAIDTRDVATLEAAVDWPAMRESLKSNFMTHMAPTIRDSMSGGSAAGQVGAALGTLMGTALLDRMVDSMITAPAFAKMLEDRVRARPLSELVSYAFFVTPTKFRVDIANPESSDEAVTFMLSLTGGSWRVSGVTLPAGAFAGPQTATSDAPKRDADARVRRR